MSIKIALAGNPNCGKTTLFNNLTGSNQYVGNWPGVTVEKKEGKLKGDKDVVIQDLPGIYSLSPYTLEEVVSRTYLVKEKPDAILNIIDGTNIERNLYLTTQLIELGIPVVMAVNMIDLVRKNGDTIDLKKLSAELGCQAVEISALKGEGTEAAAKAGVAAIVVPTAEEAAEKAAHIVGLLPANNLTGPAIFEFEQPTAVLAAGAEPAKAAAAVIDKDSAVELYAGFGKSVYTAFATIGGNAVGVVATGKQLCHNCVAKASRFVRLCDAFSVPVITIVDTEGFVPSATDDIAGGIREAARLAATYADATTAKVALIAGKAVGPVYTALAAADLKIAVKGCTISALEPSAAVSVLYKDEIDASDNIIAATKAKTAAYTAEVCSAASAVAAGAADMSCDAANVRASVVAALELLSTKRAARLPKKHGNMAL